MIDARREFVAILRGETNDCAKRDRVLAVPSLDGGWTGVGGYEFDVDLSWWFLEHFVDDIDAVRRARRACREVERFYGDLARLHFETTGEPTRLDRNLIRKLQRRILVALYPSSRAVAVGARNHPAARASASVARLIPEAAWRTKY